MQEHKINSNIRLELLDKQDFQKILEWNRNKSADYLLKWAGPLYEYPLTESQIEAYFDNDVQASNGNINLYKIIVDNTNEYIGVIELHIIDEVNGIGKIKRFLIGDEGYRGRGIGTRILEKVVNIGFLELKLNKIVLGVFDFNASAIKCYEKVGFKKGKIIRKARKSESGYWDLIEMEILKIED